MTRILALFCIVSIIGCSQDQGTSFHEGDVLRGRDPEGDGPGRVIAQSWHLVGENGINIEPAWSITRGSKNVTIAVLDNGFFPSHPVFARGQCPADITLKDLVGNERSTGNHGTSVSSLIGTCRNNPFSLTGINDLSSMLWIERGNLSTGRYVALLNWASGDPTACASPQLDCVFANSKPADVINLSFGSEVSAEDTLIASSLELPAIQAANARGSIIVAASGNEAISADTSFPAALTGVISVGATNIKGVAADFSNWGETVEIMAPGEQLQVATLDSITRKDGTSYSAPIITGVISLMKSVYSDLNWKTAIYFLQSTAKPMDCNAYCSNEYDFGPQVQCKSDCCIGNTQVCTPGRVDAGAAVAAAQRAATAGLPQVALVDSDKYLVVVGSAGSGSFTLFNVGGARGTYTLTSSQSFVTLDTDEVTLAPKGQAGDRFTVNVNADALSLFQSKGAAIRISSPESRIVSTFSDEMTIFVSPFAP